MKKFSMILVILLLSLIFAVNGFCADGDELTTTSFRVDSNGQMNYKSLTETVTTNDTVATTESGKVFVANLSTGSITFNLPTAASGLTYTFTAGNGYGGSSGLGRIYLDPYYTDKFVGCVNSQATTTFATGDSLYSPSATGDSVTIVGSTLYWYCTNRVGTWVDGNDGY